MLPLGSMNIGTMGLKIMRAKLQCKWYHSQNQGASVAKVWEKAVEIGFNLSTSKLLHSL